MELKEIAKKYGINYSTLQRKVKSGAVKAEKNGGRWEISVPVYEEWVKSRNEKKTEKINNLQCVKCVYGICLDNIPMCDYLEKTGMRRNCDTYPVCEKFRAKKKSEKNNS